LTTQFGPFDPRQQTPRSTAGTIGRCFGVGALAQQDGVVRRERTTATAHGGVGTLARLLNGVGRDVQAQGRAQRFVQASWGVFDALAFNVTAGGGAGDGNVTTRVNVREMKGQGEEEEQHFL